ncbi:integral membrane protein MviN [Longilinea arvoryzae]|uniref:Probable lipid II flippase MurJ n=2 Tax=Longilinea arvoryzae TaxID=360412 RepID=A0A0S7BFY6_9CHLR|nr:integral membrane protein MviN [Longilinea arvoryzae]
MAAFLITQAIGLLRGILVYRVFGTSADLDSFNAANRVTELLYNLMAGGALGSAFIPTFTGLLAKEQRERAWKLASAVANLLLLGLTLVAALAMIFAPQVVRHGLYVLSPGESIGQEALTVALLRVMLPTVVIFGLSGLVMGILNANQRFWLPAIAPAMYSIGQILGVLLLPRELGINRLAWGALAGSLLHLLIQLPNLLKLGGGYTLTLGRGVAEVREVISLMGPRILGVAVVQLNFFVNTIIALSLPDGSVSSITLAFTWMMMPEVAIAQSVAVAAMPTFSTQVALGKLDDLRTSLASSLRGVLLLAMPATVGLILLRTPLIRVLYEGGSFTALSTEMVAWALLWYTAGLMGHSVLEVIVRAFYALHDTRTPVTVGVVAMSLNVAFSFAFSRLFSAWGWMPHGGLALANSLATFLEMSTLVILLRRRLNGLGGSTVPRALLLGGLGSLAMGLTVWGWLSLTAALPEVVRLVGGAAAGVAIYGAVMLALRVPELNSVLAALRRRMKRKQG